MASQRSRAPSRLALIGIFPLPLLLLLPLVARTDETPAKTKDNQGRQVILMAGTAEVDIPNPEGDVDNVIQVFKDGIDKGRLKFNPTRKIGFGSKEDLEGFLSAPGGAKGMTLVCYLKLHGGTDVNGNHVMMLDDQETVVSRDWILAILRKKEARLTVLITDSCAHGPVPFTPVKPQAAVPLSELFFDLFLSADGEVDINSATYKDKAGQFPNQFAWMDNKGALFTRAFTVALSRRPMEEVVAMLAKITKSPAGHYSWQGFLDYLKEDTDSRFQVLKKAVMKKPPETVPAITLARLKNQEHQYPYSFGELPKGR